MAKSVRRSLAQSVLLLPLLTLVLTFCREAGDPSSPAVQSGPSSISAAVGSATSPGILIGASDIAVCGSTHAAETAALINAQPTATVMVLGDAAYSSGSATNYSSCYNPSWGAFKARSMPTPGERDYSTSNASGYFGYFGASAGAVGSGYYSYELGEWHVIVLNSNISMKVGSPQLNWLIADLTSSTKACTVAYWHHPRFSSSSAGVVATIKPFWDVLYAYGVDVVVNGNNRFYERFAPQNPDGVADATYGIRQFISGLGGASQSSPSTPRLPNSEIENHKEYGVLKLTLGSGTYGWEFLHVAGKTFTDAGTGTCHGQVPPIAAVGGPYISEGSVAFDGSKSYDPRGTPLTYAWDFGDGTTGTGVSPTHTYPGDGTYTVSLVVTDGKGTPSVASTTTAKVGNIVPTVTLGTTPIAYIGEQMSMTFTVGDNPADAPWSYTVNWGDGISQDVGTVPAQGVSIPLTHTYAAAGDYAFSLTVTDLDGGVGSAAASIPVRDRNAAQILIGAGDIADCGKTRDNETGKLLDLYPTATIFTVGDNVYDNGTLTEYQNCYEPAWGGAARKARTRVTIGNHEYNTGNANGTWDYFGDRAGPRGLGYYSYDLGDWHIIVLNDNASYVPYKDGSVQDLWLQKDLATNTKKCVMAMWHQSFFYSASSSSAGYSSSRKIFWDRLYAAGADVVLTAHHHFYERLAPADPNMKRDDVRGIRSFVLGMGGEGSTAPTANIHPLSEQRSSAFGVMKFTLLPGSYEWEFLPIPGYTYNDKGSGVCH